MNIQELQSSNQSELYRIRKNTAQQTEAAEAEKISQQLTEQQPAQVDEYDKANPVGEEVKGIYSVSRDEEGNLKVNYTQPAESKSKSESKSENEKDSEKVQASGNSGKSQGASGVQQTSETEDSNEEEVEKLKKQRDAVKAQLRSEQDEAVKSQLRTQLQNIEAQIALKSASINS
ncbi:MAG: hypothetical protein IJR35_05065 [Synergistaceae bacterium]|nr:hypothetical protein [Synergistaceae bacterium]MBQ9404857.1 hypothetical protein [Synergistaceae bacterium]MBQ9595212.1 hypothetical protein [Synergistaceae bacterium]